MMQMRKQNAAPMIAEMSSNVGTRIANKMMTTVTAKRNIDLTNFVKNRD